MTEDEKPLSEILRQRHDAVAGFWTKITGTLLDKEAGSDEKDQALFAVAEYVRKNPHRHKRHPLPRRPQSVGDDDDILDSLEKSKRSAESNRSLNMFHAWRMAVTRTEGKNAATLAMLLRAAQTFHRLGIPEATAEVEAFMRDEFGWNGTTPISLHDVRKQSAFWSMDYEVLSVDLRYGERQRTSTPEEHPEDDLSFMDDFK